MTIVGHSTIDIDWNGRTVSVDGGTPIPAVAYSRAFIAIDGATEAGDNNPTLPIGQALALSAVLGATNNDFVPAPQGWQWTSGEPTLVAVSYDAARSDHAEINAVATIPGGAIVKVRAVAVGTGCEDTIDVYVPAPVPPPPSLMMTYSAPATGTVDTLAGPVVVTVADAAGNPVPGVAVSFAVLSGGGMVERKDNAPTGAAGRAACQWLLGPDAGVQKMQAIAQGAASIVIAIEAQPAVGTPPVTSPPTTPGTAPGGSTVDSILGPSVFDTGDTLAAALLVQTRTSLDQHYAARAGMGVLANYYDVAATCYHLARATGDAQFDAMGDAFAREDIAAWKPNGYHTAPRNYQPRGIEVYYLRTRDPEAVKYITTQWNVVMEKYVDPDAAFGYHIGDTHTPPSANMENRQAARTISAALAMHCTLGIDMSAELRRALDMLAAFQSSDGGHRYHQTAPFMDGLLNSALIDYRRRFEADPRIDGIIDRNNDFLWSLWMRYPNVHAFPYAYTTVQQDYHADVNNLIVSGFADRAQRTGDATHIAIVRSIISASLHQGFWVGAKQCTELVHWCWSSYAMAA